MQCMLHPSIDDHRDVRGGQRKDNEQRLSKNSAQPPDLSMFSQTIARFSTSVSQKSVVFCFLSFKLNRIRK